MGGSVACAATAKGRCWPIYGFDISPTDLSNPVYASFLRAPHMFIHPLLAVPEELQIGGGRGAGDEG